MTRPVGIPFHSAAFSSSCDIGAMERQILTETAQFFSQLEKRHVSLSELRGGEIGSSSDVDLICNMKLRERFCVAGMQFEPHSLPLLPALILRFSYFYHLHKDLHVCFPEVRLAKQLIDYFCLIEMKELVFEPIHGLWRDATPTPLILASNFPAPPIAEHIVKRIMEERFPSLVLSQVVFYDGCPYSALDCAVVNLDEPLIRLLSGVMRDVVDRDVLLRPKKAFQGKSISAYLQEHGISGIG